MAEDDARQKASVEKRCGTHTGLARLDPRMFGPSVRRLSFLL